MPVGIERQRHTVRQDVIAQGREIRRAGFHRREVQCGQPAGRVVNEHDQRAARAAPLEPGVRAPVDLDQLAEPRPALAQLEHAPGTPLLRPPQAELDLEPAHRLDRYLDPVQLRQLLRRQRRTEIRVLLRQQRTYPLAKVTGHATVRRPAALARHKARVTAGPPVPHQALELPYPDPPAAPTPPVATSDPRSPGAPETHDPAPRRSSKLLRLPSVPRAQKGFKGDILTLRRGDILMLG